jgi:membrane protein implicated in regulation of membrane protease activity
MKPLLAKTLKERRLNLAAGALILWVALGPWVWGYATSPAAVASHVFFIFAFGPLTLLIAVLLPAAGINVAALVPTRRRHHRHRRQRDQSATNSTAVETAGSRS